MAMRSGGPLKGQSLILYFIRMHLIKVNKREPVLSMHWFVGRIAYSHKQYGLLLEGSHQPYFLGLKQGLGQDSMQAIQGHDE